MIAVEDLAIENMAASAKGTAEKPGRNVRQKAGLNREILDPSPSTFAAMLRYKAERAGSQFAAVDARGTSVECSACGGKVPNDLSVRMHVCPRCDLGIGRDVNAARNILGRAVVGPWSGFGIANGEVLPVAPETSGRREVDSALIGLTHYPKAQPSAALARSGVGKGHGPARRTGRLRGHRGPRRRRAARACW